MTDDFTYVDLAQLETIVPLLGYPIVVRLKGDDAIHGYLLNVDPVTRMMMLVQKKLAQEPEESEPMRTIPNAGPPETPAGTRYSIHVVMAHAILAIEPDLYSNTTPEPLTSKQITEVFERLAPDNINLFQNVREARDSLIRYLTKQNRIQLSSPSDSNVVALLNGAVTIEPPYTLDCIKSRNEVMSSEVKGMVREWRGQMDRERLS